MHDAADTQTGSVPREVVRPVLAPVRLQEQYERVDDAPPGLPWDEIAALLPPRLAGWQVLEVGCQPCFYGSELAKIGAKVTGISASAGALRAAYHQSRRAGVEESVRFKEMLVYELARDRRMYELVIFSGSLQQLRYPQLALDVLARKVRRLFLLQTLPAAPGRDRAGGAKLAEMIAASGLRPIESPREGVYWCEPRVGQAQAETTAEYLSAVGLNW